MSNITYIRHFEQRNHAVADPPLKPVRAPLPDYGEFDLIVCSPYRRCRETAQLINAGKNRPIVVDVRLSEYQGQRRRTCKLEPQTVAHGPVPGPNEPWEDCQARLDAHYEACQQRPGRVLVVTHGICVRYLQIKVEGRSPWVRGRHVPFGQGFSC